MVIKKHEPRYPRRGPSCLLVLCVMFGVGLSIFVTVNAESVRDVIVPTAIPTPTRSATELGLLADLAEQDNEYEEALSYYRQAISLDGTRAEIYIRFIHLLIQEGEAEEALEVAERATVLAPENQNVWVALAAAYIANGDRLGNVGDSTGANLEYARAVQSAQRALAIEETAIAYAYAAGGLVLQQDPNKYAQAEEYADTAILLEPNNDIARYYMATVFTYLGLYDEAIAQYQMGIQANPDNADLYIGLAWNYYGGRNSSADAINAFEDALSIDPTSAEAADGVAYMYLQLGQPEVAQGYAAQAVLLDPNMARAHGRLGQAYYRQFNYAEAIKVLEEATRLYGDVTDLNATYFNVLATAYIRAGLENCDTAVPIFQKVAQTNSLAAEEALEGLEECRLAAIESGN